MQLPPTRYNPANRSFAAVPRLLTPLPACACAAGSASIPKGEIQRHSNPLSMPYSVGTGKSSSTHLKPPPTAATYSPDRDGGRVMSWHGDDTALEPRRASAPRPSQGFPF